MQKATFFYFGFVSNISAPTDEVCRPRRSTHDPSRREGPGTCRGVAAPKKKYRRPAMPPTRKTLEPIFVCFCFAGLVPKDFSRPSCPNCHRFRCPHVCRVFECFTRARGGFVGVCFSVHPPHYSCSGRLHWRMAVVPRLDYPRSPGEKGLSLNATYMVREEAPDYTTLTCMWQQCLEDAKPPRQKNAMHGVDPNGQTHPRAGGGAYRRAGGHCDPCTERHTAVRPQTHKQGSRDEISEVLVHPSIRREWEATRAVLLDNGYRGRATCPLHQR